MTRLVLIVLAAALLTHQWHIAAGAFLIVAIPLAFKLGGQHTARRSGVGPHRHPPHPHREALMFRCYLSPASLRALAQDLAHAWRVVRDGHYWRTHPPLPSQSHAEAREAQRLAKQHRDAS